LTSKTHIWCISGFVLKIGYYRVSSHCWRGSSGVVAVVVGGIVVRGHDSIHDVEAHPRGVIAVRLEIKVRLCGGVKASSPLFC